MWTYSNSRYSIVIVEKGIVEKGIQLVQEFNTVIVGDDTNLLVMMLDRFKDTMTSHDLYMFRPSSDTLLNIGQLLGVVPEKVLKCLLLVHCASGCDTVSSISGIGKTRLVKQIEKTEYPLSMMELDVFYRPHLEPDDENLIKVGTKLLIALYLVPKVVRLRQHKNPAFTDIFLYLGHARAHDNTKGCIHQKCVAVSLVFPAQTIAIVKKTMYHAGISKKL